MERERWNLRWHERDLHCPDAPGAAETAVLDSLPPGRALDLACGAGRHAVWLAELGWQVTAVDFSDTALALARRRARERGVEVEWVLADVALYEPEPAAFDLVLVLYLHVPPDERRTILARCARALVPGGTILVLGHDLANLGTGAPGPSSNPEVLYTPGQVTACLDGLDIDRAEQVGRIVETDEGEAEAIDTLVVARRPP